MGRTKVQMQARPSGGEPEPGASVADVRLAEVKMGEGIAEALKEDPVNSNPAAPTSSAGKVAFGAHDAK